jgi:acyl-CoA thioester hydrolase
MVHQQHSATMTRHIEWVDTDAAGHQHNSVILRFVEACEAQLFRNLNVPDYFGQAPRVRQEVNFRAKLYFGQTVTTTVSLDRLGRSSMTFSFEVWGEAFNDKPRKLSADGSFVTVCVPHGSEASQPWPDTLRAALNIAPGTDMIRRNRPEDVRAHE